MKFSSFFSFVALALALGVAAAPVGNSGATGQIFRREQDAADGEEFLGPLFKIGGKLVPKIAKVAVPKLSHAVQRAKKITSSPFTQSLLGDALGAAGEVASDALPAVADVAEDLLLRDMEKADKKKKKKSKAKKADDEDATPLVAAPDASSDLSTDASSVTDDISTRDMEEQAKKKKKRTKAAPPPAEDDEADAAAADADASADA